MLNQAREHILATLAESYNGKVRTGGFEMYNGPIPNGVIRQALGMMLEEGSVLEEYDGWGTYYVRGVNA